MCINLPLVFFFKKMVMVFYIFLLSSHQASSGTPSWTWGMWTTTRLCSRQRSTEGRRSQGLRLATLRQGNKGQLFLFSLVEHQQPFCAFSKSSHPLSLSSFPQSTHHFTLSLPSFGRKTGWRTLGRRCCHLQPPRQEHLQRCLPRWCRHRGDAHPQATRLTRHLIVYLHTSCQGHWQGCGVVFLFITSDIKIIFKSNIDVLKYLE